MIFKSFLTSEGIEGIRGVITTSTSRVKESLLLSRKSTVAIGIKKFGMVRIYFKTNTLDQEKYPKGLFIRTSGIVETEKEYEIYSEEKITRDGYEKALRDSINEAMEDLASDISSHIFSYEKFEYALNAKPRKKRRFGFI